MLDVRLVPVLNDNYIFLARDDATGAVAVIDPAVADPVLQRLDELDWRLTHILNTHHHRDHTGGNLDLVAATGASVAGPAGEADRIPGITRRLTEGDRVALGETVFTVIDVPGHTAGHIAFHAPAVETLFCGDTLFVAGCGRLFEGTAEQMWHSLGRLSALPPATRVYCAHEYTEANCRFAITVDPENPDLEARVADVARRRAANAPTVPSTIGDERRTNPFLRADQKAVMDAVGMPDGRPVDVFAEIRRRKDRF